MIFNGERLKALREAKLLSRLEFAKRLSVSDPQIGRWEGGSAVPRPATIKRICKVLGVPASELVGEGTQETATL